MKTMISKFPGTCRACGGAINRGELINFFGRGHAEHAHACKTQADKKPDGACWNCKAENGFFRNMGAATPVWCDQCFAAELRKTQLVGNVRFSRRDNSSAEDACCGDMAYEDACAAACGL
jgi:hypothetical protein